MRRCWTTEASTSVPNVSTDRVALIASMTPNESHHANYNHKRATPTTLTPHTTPDSARTNTKTLVERAADIAALRYKLKSLNDADLLQVCVRSRRVAFG